MPGFRKHGRKLAKCAVSLVLSEMGEVRAETRDISETGVFLNSRDLANLVAVGDRVSVKLHGVADAGFSEARMMVVRLTEDGVGFVFD